MNPLETFIKYLRYERQYSEHTVTSYKKDLEQFSQFLITHLDVKSIDIVSHIHVRSWLVHLMKADFTNKSINRKLSSLKSYYKFQMKLGHVEANPAAGISGPKLAKRLPQVLREAEIKEGLLKLEEDDSFSSKRDLIMINLLYQTGIRRSELINLRERDINISRKSIKVLGKGNKERLIPISSELGKLIMDYVDIRNKEFGRCEILIVTDKGEKMYPKFVYNKIKGWIERISTINKKSPHILRHSFATHLADNGAELNAIKALLGHESLAATQIYTHNSINRLKDVYNKAHPRA